LDFVLFAVTRSMFGALRFSPFFHSEDLNFGLLVCRV